MLTFNQLIAAGGILLAILSGLIYFFGKVITDQFPFADDRKWAIELYGTFFLIKLSIPSILGFGLAYYAGGPKNFSFIYFIFISISIALVSLMDAELTNKIYDIPNPFKISFEQLESTFIGISKIERNLTKWSCEQSLWIKPLSIFGIAYILTRTFLEKSPITFILFSTLTLFYLFIFAYHSSLKTIAEMPTVTVFLKGENNETITGKLLKMNPDNLKLKLTDRNVIINKDSFLKIEWPIKK